MTLRLVEPIVEALTARLAADLPAAVAAVNAAVTDGYTIENAQAVIRYVPPLPLIPGFPAVAIGRGRMTLEDDNAWSATGAAALTLVCLCQDPDPLALSYRLERFTLAVARAALANRSLGSGSAGWGITVTDVFYGDAMPETPLDSEEPPRSFVSWAAISLTVRHDED